MEGKSFPFNLLWALRVQARKDSSPQRCFLFHTYLKKRPMACMLYQWLAALNLPNVKSGVCLLYAGLVSFKGAVPVASRLGLYRLANEKKTLDKLAGLLSGRGITLVGLDSKVLDFSWVLPGFESPSGWQNLVKVFRVFKRFGRRYDLYVCLRLAEALLIYAHLLRQCKGQGIQVIFHSSEGNPHGTAVMLTANRLGLPLVFCSHAPVSVQPGAFVADLAIFYGRKAIQDYQKVGARFRHVMTYGSKNRFRKVSPVSAGGYRVCIASSKGSSDEVLQELISCLECQKKVEKIRVRLHPHDLYRQRKLKSKTGKLILTGGATSIDDELMHSNVVIAGNSNIHLDFLLRGVPSLYWPGMDQEPQSLDFLVDKMVYAFELNSPLGGQLDRAVDMYMSTEWVNKFCCLFDVFKSDERFVEELSQWLEKKWVVNKNEEDMVSL